MTYRARSTPTAQRQPAVPMNTPDMPPLPPDTDFAIGVSTARGGHWLVIHATQNLATEDT